MSVPRRGAGVEIGGLLQRVRGVQQRAFLEVVADQLQADRQPGLAEARVVHSEANLRPALPDNLPAHTHQPGLSRINGLFRHGWLIAPALVHQALGAVYSTPPTTQTAPATPSPTPVSAA